MLCGKRTHGREWGEAGEGDGRGEVLVKYCVIRRKGASIGREEVGKKGVRRNQREERRKWRKQRKRGGVKGTTQEVVFCHGG